MSQALHIFVKESLAQGLGRPATIDALRKAGWGDKDIENALSAFAEVDFPIPVPSPKVTMPSGAAVYHLLFFAMLIGVISNGIDILFTLVGWAFAEEKVSLLVTLAENSLWSIAALVVMIPVLLFAWQRISTMVKTWPATRRLPIRRILTFIMLFITAMVLCGTLIAVVYDFLTGEMTPLFLTQCVILGGIGALIFGGFLTQLKADENTH